MSRYLGSFLEKLVNIDLNEPVEISPYNFEDEKTGKKITGISVKQDDVKVESAYKEKVGTKWVMKYGFPPFPDGWHTLPDRKKKEYFFDVDDFFTKALAEWRELVAGLYGIKTINVDGSQVAPSNTGNAERKAKESAGKVTRNTKIEYTEHIPDNVQNRNEPSDDLPFRMERNYFTLPF